MSRKIPKVLENRFLYKQRVAWDEIHLSQAFHYSLLNKLPQSSRLPFLAGLNSYLQAREGTLSFPWDANILIAWEAIKKERTERNTLLTSYASTWRIVSRQPSSLLTRDGSDGSWIIHIHQRQLKKWNSHKADFVHSYKEATNEESERDIKLIVYTNKNNFVQDECEASKESLKFLVLREKLFRWHSHKFFISETKCEHAKIWERLEEASKCWDSNTKVIWPEILRRS